MGLVPVCCVVSATPQQPLYHSKVASLQKAPLGACPVQWRGGLGLLTPGGTRGEAAATTQGAPQVTAAHEGKAGPRRVMPAMPIPLWGKRDRAVLDGPQTAPRLGICPSRSLQMPVGASQPHWLLKGVISRWL